MKLRDMIKGRQAILRDVRFRPMTAAVQPGRAPLEAAPEDILVGIRGLSGEEIASVYEKAQQKAREKGVEKWDQDHPICLLYEKAFTILFAVVAVPQDPKEPIPENPEQFFDSVEEILNSSLVGRDNIVYLHERFESWMEESGVKTHRMKPEEIIGLAMREVELPENQHTPLELLGPALLVSSLRFMAHLLFGSQISRLPFGSATEPKSEPSKSDSKRLPSNPEI